MDTIMHWLSGIAAQDDKLQLMRSKASLLRARAADINSELEHEELHPGKRRKREVEYWLKSVNKVDTQVQCLEQQLKDSSKLESGTISQAGYLTKEIGELIEKGCFLQGLTFYDHGSTSLPLVTPGVKISNHKFEDSKRKIMSFLTGESPVYSVGVYGPGGVGKTTLLKEIHNELLEKSVSSSGNIYWVSVSHGTAPSILLDKIAEAVGLSYILDEKNETRKASKLHHEMQRRKNDVLILDDMWEHFSLDEIGIPNSCCKLIIATRSLDVCKRMKCCKIVKVEPLCQEEAWNLFSKVLGTEIPLDVQHIARLVAAECAGLPLGITVMAGSMRGVTDIQEWRNTLEELHNSAIGQSDMEKDVLPVLRLSYDRLKDPKLQQCFLLCSLYPKDSEIPREELIMLVRSEGLLDGLESWEKQTDRAHSMLNKLENMCLLERSRLSRLTMHNLIREMAIRVSQKVPKYMISAGAKLRKIPSRRRWTIDLEKVSLMQNSLSEIQPGTVPLCPSLSTLLLQRNPFTKLPDSFFEHMKGLRVLNLSNTRMKRLPSSVSELENLRSLLLESCSRLVFVPSLVKLTKLRAISFRSCWSLKDVPHGMTRLDSIKFLDLEGSKNLCRLLGGSLLALSNIQCLKLDPDIPSLFGDELVKLRELERLEGCRIPDVGTFSRCVKTLDFQHLKCFEFVVGRGEYKRTGYNYTNSEGAQSASQRIVIACSSRLGDGDERKLFVPPENTQYLQIHNCDFSTSNLVDAFPSLYNSTALMKMLVRRCRVIECAWSPQSSFEVTPPIRNLRELFLTDLQDFRGLVDENVALPQGAFSNLKTLVIKFCPKIRKLFTCNLLKSCLDNLQELEVEGCEEMEEIIAEDGITEINQNGLIRLPNLRALQLRRLPKLRSICHKGLLGNGSLERIVVEYCGEIKTLFMASLHLRPLVNLKEVRVTACKNLQEIIATGHSSDCPENSTLELPNLRTLEIDDLPSLTSFFPGKLLPCCFLEQITIRNCPYLRKLPLFGSDLPLAVPCLQDINADRDWWESLDWDNPQLKQFLQPFTKLYVANISSFNNLKEVDTPRGGLGPEGEASTMVNGIDVGSCCTQLRHQDSTQKTEAEFRHEVFRTPHSKQIERHCMDNLSMKEILSVEDSQNIAEAEAKSEGRSSQVSCEVGLQETSTEDQTTVNEQIEQLRASNVQLTAEVERVKMELQMLRSQLPQVAKFPTSSL